MSFRRKQIKVGDANVNTPKKENHVRNIALMLAAVLGGITLKIILGGVQYDPNGNILQRTLTSQPLTENKNWTDRTGTMPTPEVAQEIQTMKAEVESLRKNNRELTLLSRGSFDRSRMVTYDYKKLRGSKTILDLILLKTSEVHATGDLQKEFFKTIYAIISYESKFDPMCRALTKTEDSRGLLQVNTYTNYPKSSDPNLLYDPEFNLSYQLPELYNFYIAGKMKGYQDASLAKYVARFGQRYNYNDIRCRQDVERTIDRAYVELANAEIKTNN